MSPPPEEADKYDEFKYEMRKHMESILNYYNGINTRSLSIQKEFHNLRYLLELKRSKTISIFRDEDNQTLYETKHKMYLTKLSTKQI